jgi:hypothetical protein
MTAIQINSFKIRKPPPMAAGYLLLLLGFSFKKKLLFFKQFFEDRWLVMYSFDQKKAKVGLKAGTGPLLLKHLINGQQKLKC